MANAYSLLNNFDEKIFSPDINLINTVLQTKQSKLDNNRLKIEQALSEVENLDLIRDVDKQYAANRLNKVNSIVDKYANMDLSSSNLTRSLTADISQVMDDKVKSALISTKIYRGEQEKWAEFSQKNPDKYSQANHAYAMRGADSWLNSQELGQSYNGGGGIIEYTDFKANLNEKLPKALEKVGIKTVINDFGERIFLDNEKSISMQQAIDKVQEISGGKVEQIARQILGDKDYQQMQINAWNDYGRGQDVDKVRSAYKSYVQNEKQSLQTTLKEYQDLLKTPEYQNNPDEKEKLESVVNALKNRVNSKDDLLNNTANKSFSEMSFTMYEGSFMEGVKNTYQMEPTLLERKVQDNKYALKTLEHLFEMEEIEARNSFENKSTSKSKQISVGDSNFTEQDVQEAMRTGTTKQIGNQVITGTGVILQVEPGAGITDATNSEEAIEGKVKAFNKLVEEDYAILSGGDNPIFKGPLNSETLNQIDKYPLFSNNLTEEQNKALYRIKNNKAAKLAEIQEVVTTIDSTVEEGLNLLIKSPEVTFENQDDFAFEVIIENSKEKVIPSENPNMSFGNLLKKAHEKGLDEMSDLEKSTLNYKMKLNVVKDAVSSGLPENLADVYLREIGLKLDINDEVLPKNTKELNGLSGGEPVSINPFNSEIRGPLLTHVINPYMQGKSKEVFQEKVLPYLDKIGYTNLSIDGEQSSKIFDITNSLVSGESDSLSTKDKDFFKKFARGHRLKKSNGFYDTNLLDIDPSEFVDKDGNPLKTIEGTKVSFPQILENLKTKLVTDVKKTVTPNVLTNYENNFIVENPTEQLGSTLNVIYNNVTGDQPSELNQLSLQKGTQLKFTKVSDNRYAIEGDFNYKKPKDGGGTSNEVIKFTDEPGDLGKSEEGKGYMTIEASKLKNFIQLPTDKNTFNPYSINQQKDNAKSFVSDKKLIEVVPITSNLPGFTSNSIKLLDDKFSKTFREQYEFYREKGIDLPEITEEDLLNIVESNPIDVETSNIKGRYHKVVKLQGSDTPIFHAPIGDGNITELSYEALRILNDAVEEDKAKAYLNLIINSMENQNENNQQ